MKLVLALLLVGVIAHNPIADAVGEALFWVNKKTLHGFCSAYRNQDYMISQECYDKTFREGFYTRTGEVFKDIFDLDILKPWVFDDHVLSFIKFVETELITCGCQQWVNDLETYITLHIKDKEPF